MFVNTSNGESLVTIGENIFIIYLYVFIGAHVPMVKRLCKRNVMQLSSYACFSYMFWEKEITVFSLRK